MTVSVALFRWIGRSISFRQRMAVQDLFAHTPREDIFGLIRSVIRFTVGAEVIGAVILTALWSRDQPFTQAAFSGIFHSISAFCNAGFSLFSDSLIRFSGNIPINLVVCALIVAGGIGFPVLYDVECWIKCRNGKRRKLSIQTKTVLLTTAILIVAGASMFAFLERRIVLESTSVAHRILTPIFQSITCRTAGFNTVDIASLNDATIAMMIFLMFFGASPGSCGGGVKTTTLALMTAFTFSRIRRQKRVNLFRKSVPIETVTRSLSLVLVSIGIIGLVLFFILAGDTSGYQATAHSQKSFLAHLFETVSAFGTVGLSMGVTPELDIWGKSWIILMMIVGRVGVLTFSYIVVGSGQANGIEYSEENMMIG